MIKRALISVSNKSGLEELVKTLGAIGAEIVSSGGTAKKIRELGYAKLTEVSDYTGHPESPGGLLKTLHPRVHGGLLLSRDIPEHREFMDKHGIKPFEMVVVNLYPFEATVAKGAELLVHEATFLEKQHDKALEALHSTAKEAAEIAKKAKVKKLALFHFSARNTDEKEILEEAKAEFVNTIIPQELETITV